jgi:hypothetical protein
VYFAPVPFFYASNNLKIITGIGVSVVMEKATMPILQRFSFIMICNIILLTIMKKNITNPKTR